MAGLHSLRTRWAAIGAACAVTLGGGTLGIVRATVSSGERAIYVPISPVRVLDTRSGSKVVNDTLRLVVEGTISAGGTMQQVVPAEASAVAINVTATGNQKNGDYGFVTAFPCTSEDDAVPNASSLNFETGVDIANALNVTTSSNGSICLYVYGSAHLIVDVAGYYTDHNHDDRYFTQAQTNVLVDSAMSAPAFGRQIWTKSDALSTTFAGYSNSISIGADGMPFAFHYKTDTQDLIFTKCDDVVCTSSSNQTIGTGGDRGSMLSGTLGSTGNPVVAFYEAMSGDLYWAYCGDAACTSESLVQLDGSSEDVGQYPSLNISDSDFAVISYYDATNGNLKVTRCTKINCPGGSYKTTYTVDSSGFVGKASSLTIGTDGLPVISYFDQTNETLKVAHCNDAPCSSATLTTVGPTGVDIDSTSIAIGVDGFPIIAFYDSRAGDLWTIHCANTACTSTTSATNLHSLEDVGRSASITIGLDGLPLIAYVNSTHNENFVDRCSNMSCTATTSHFLTSNAGPDNAITIGSDGLPIVSSVWASGGLRFIHQTRTSWTKNGWGR